MAPLSVPSQRAFLVLRRLERGIGVIDLPVGLLVVLGRVQHVLVEALAVDGQTLGARLADRRDAGRRGDVHHVERSAGHALDQPQHTAEAQILGQRVVHLGQVLENRRGPRGSAWRTCA